MFEFENINLLAVLATVVISMVIGFLWYSPMLFGNVWVRLIGLKPDEMRPAVGPMAGTVAATIVASFLLAMFIEMTGAKTAFEGFVVAFLLSIVLAAKIAINYFFESRGFRLYLLTMGYHVLPYLIGGAVLGAWQ